MGRYILLPRTGLRARTGPAANVLWALPHVRSTEPSEQAPLEGRSVEVIDAALEDGPRLVQVDDETAAALNRPDSPVRAVPEVAYRRPDVPPPPAAVTTSAPSTHATGAGTATVVTCEDAATGTGLPGVQVIAFTDSGRNEGWTDKTGNVTLALTGSRITRILASPPPGYWGAQQGPLPIAPVTLALKPVELGFVDCLRHYYSSTKFDVNAGVRVGVIDTGVGPHQLINLTGGRNTVTGEPPGDYADGALHGTHVAGIVGANGTPPKGIRGMAPGVEILSYRVFPPDAGATNYAILKALIFAAADGCDIVNLSLGGGPREPIVEEAITDARNAGMLVVVATGNDGRRPISYPAAYPGAVAVTAMGREALWPPGTGTAAFVARPPDNTIDHAEFIASFSNVGPQATATAPGVGVLSTLPHDSFGPMSGTSMAAPAVTGAIACLLSHEPPIHALARDATRSQAIANLLTAHCTQRGFGQVYEGAGMPDPAKI